MRTIVAFAIICLGLSSTTHGSSPWTGTWIWTDPPREHVYFRKLIDVGPNIANAKLAITADNIYTVFVNGTEVGTNNDWTNIEVYDISDRLKPGKNIIAVKATDPGGSLGGLLVEAAVVYADGSALLFGTDKTWRMSFEEIPNWTSLEFDDSNWITPKEIGKPPVGPWGGLGHPSLLPEVPMETIAVYWPKNVKPGDRVKVICKVCPERRIPVESPVALRILSRGEIVYEQWIEPDSPITTWEPHKIKSITFPEFYLPIYVPCGRLQAQVVTNATDGTRVQDIWIGPRPSPTVPKPPITISDLRVVPTRRDNFVEINVSASVKNVPKSNLFLFTLTKGEETWFAADLSSVDSARVTLPPEFPGGVYTAKLVLHNSTSRAVAEYSVNIPGPVETTLKPLGCGTYRDRNGVRHHWYINKAGTLIWDGKPYVPVGAMYLSSFFMDFTVADVAHNEEAFRADLARLKNLVSAGVTDLYLNPCRNWKEKPAWVWQRFADMCEEVGVNYGIQVTNHIRPLKGYHIAQDEYVVRIKGGETAKAQITGTYVGRPDPNSTILYAAFDPKSGELIETGKATVKPANIGVEAEATPQAKLDGELNVHFIPEYTFSGDMHDYWQGIDDAYKNELRSFFSAIRLGPKFRLWIDPLDNEQSFRDLNRLLPHSARFRTMFAEYLRGKYKTVSACVESWAIEHTGDIRDFISLARLIPLGKPSSDPDIGYVLDEITGRAYKVDLTKSTMWFDMLRFRDSSIAEFNSVVADLIKKHHDVPVVLKVTDTDCFTNLRTHGGFDGLGMEAYGAAPELVRGCGGGVYSRCKMANRTMWTLVTETGLASPDVPVGYPDPLRMMKELGSMVEMNAKGTFCFLLSAPSGRPGEGWYIFNLFEDPRQLYWLGAFGKLMKSAASLKDYEPEVDYYFPGSIAGQHNGFARAKQAFFGDIPSQSVAGESGRWVVPASTKVPVDARRLIVNLEDSPATEIYGVDFERLINDLQIVMVGYRRNLGTLSIDSYYTDKFVKDDTGVLVQALNATHSSNVFARTPDGTAYGLTDGNLTIYTRPDWLNAARKMAGAPKKEQFFKEILGLEEVDLGKAFQGVRFGPYTYLWNLTDREYALTIRVPEVARGAAGNVCRLWITFADGKRNSPQSGECVKLLLPANAQRPVIIENLQDVNCLSGIDAANMAAALREWTDALEFAKRVGIETTVAPPSNNWRDIYNLAAELRKRADVAMRTTNASEMRNVVVDGDLSEWLNIKPLHLKVDVGRDYSTIADYEGARFYLGYDDMHIYIAGEVVDEAVVNNYRLDSLWNGDAVEVFLDLKPDVNPLSHNYTADCFQFIFAPTSIEARPSVVVKSPGLPPNSVPQRTQWAVKRAQEGWRFEAAIHSGDINGFQPKAGVVVGFNIQLDDSDGGDRISEKLWRGGKDASRNRLSMGRLVFAE